MDPNFLLQLLINGVVIGVIYALVATGLSLVHGVLDIVNFAHGEFYMLGAMAVFLVTRYLGLNYWVSVPLVTAASVVVGFLLYQTLLSSLKQDQFERSILLTLGLSMVLQNGAVYVFSTTPKIVSTPYTYSNFAIGGLQIPVVRVFALAIGIAAFVFLYWMLYRTQTGRAMRGVSQSRVAAQMVGIDARSVSRLAVAIGIGLAGLAGAALAPVYAVHPLMGFSFIFKAFAIIIIGGMGNITGAAIVAVSLGVIENLIAGFASQVAADAFVFCAMIAVLLVKPHGLFGQGMRV